jgi:hypothetical protein
MILGLLLLSFEVRNAIDFDGSEWNIGVASLDLAQRSGHRSYIALRCSALAKGNLV